MIGPVDGVRVIAVVPQWVFAYSASDGSVLWARDNSSSPTFLSAWLHGDRVVVSDMRSVLDLVAATGGSTLGVALASMEETNYKNDNPDGTMVEIRDVLPAGERFVVSLSTATVAINRSGQTSWRIPRAVDTQGRRLSPPLPIFADGQHVICREYGDQVRITMRQMNNGALVWQVPDTFSQPITAPPPPSPEPGKHADPAWQRVEGRATDEIVVLRAGSEIQARRMADGRLVWHHTSQAPVAAMEVAVGLVLVASDRLRAHSFEDGAVAWEVPMAGARLATPPAGGWIAAADRNELAILEFGGKIRKRIPKPLSVRDAEVLQLTVDTVAAYMVVRDSDDLRELIALAL